MLYSLSFAPEFFWGTVPIEKLKPSPRPTSVYQAVLSLPHDRWTELARDVFHCAPITLMSKRSSKRSRRPTPVRIWIHLFRSTLTRMDGSRFSCTRRPHEENFLLG